MGPAGVQEEEEREALTLRMDLVRLSAEQSPMMTALVPNHQARQSSQRSQNLCCFSVPAFPQLQQSEREETSLHLQGQLFFKLRLQLTG